MCRRYTSSMRSSRTLLVLGSIVALSSPLVARADTTLADGAPFETFDVDDAFVTGVGLVTAFRFLPDGRMLIAAKDGDVRIRSTTGTLSIAATLTVDSGSERGVLGIAVDPHFTTNQRIFIYYSGGPSVANRHRVSSFTMTGDTIDLASEQVLVENLEGPANHDGGALSIHDHYLFVGTGDTGCNQTTPQAPALHRNLLSTSFNSANGKVLRIDIDGPTIPADNPYVGATNVSGIPLPYSAIHTDGDHCPAGSSGVLSLTGDAARPEIYALGFRNAFRVWADPKTGYVWVGDVGEVEYEEIDVVKSPGGHYGWPFIEGPERFGWTDDQCATLSPNPGNCISPVYSCHHDAPATLDGVTYDGDCKSITGGLIVDSCTFPESFRGQYFFGDNALPHLWTLAVNTGRDGFTGARQDFATIDGTLTELVEGPDGALYFSIISDTPHITRISPKTPAGPACPPGSGGSGGAGGAGGSAGSSGAAGSSGSAGTSQGGSAGSSGSAGASAAGGTSGTSGAAGAGSSAAPASSSDDGSCSTAPGGTGSGWWLGLLAAAGLVTRSRRRSS